MDIDMLLGDAFIEFGHKIAELAAQRKSLKKQFKEVYEKYLVDVKIIEDEAARLQKEFENLQKEAETNVGDG